MLKRPSVLLKCRADTDHAPAERIVEFSFSNGKGGLISFQEIGGQFIVTIYRLESSIEVKNMAMSSSVLDILMNLCNSASQEGCTDCATVGLKELNECRKLLGWDPLVSE